MLYRKAVTSAKHSGARAMESASHTSLWVGVRKVLRLAPRRRMAPLDELNARPFS